MSPAAQDWRHHVLPQDVERIGRLVAATGLFSAAEVEIATELADAACQRGAASGYHFLLAGPPGALAGYTCYGPIGGTLASWDLYWIAVDPAQQGAGVGRQLLAETERRIEAAGGSRIYVETSAREQYRGTRAFYARLGYAMVAELPDFYAPGDGKLILLQTLPSGRR